MYKPNELKQECIGIYKRFPKFATYKNNVNNWSVDYSKEKSRLDRCASGERFSFSHLDEEQCKKFGTTYDPKPYNCISLTRDLNCFSTRKILDSYVLCFSGNDAWENVFREAIAYRYWATRMELIHYEVAFSQYQNGERRQLLKCHLRHVGITIGFCISLGWLDYAIDLRNRVSFSLENGLVNDGFDDFGRRRTQHFLIRLLNSYDGTQDIQEKLGIRCAYDVPLLNELIEQWEGECIDSFIKKLYALCDRHTHQCRQDSFNSNRYYDFQNLSLEYYFPVEILSILKLRMKRSLEIPEIDHPIMKAGLAKINQNTELFESEYLNSLIEFAKSGCQKI